MFCKKGVLVEVSQNSQQKTCVRVSFLKLVSAIFYQMFIFHQMIALQKLRKTFFTSPKKLFLYFCLPLFFPCQPLL